MNDAILDDLETPLEQLLDNVLVTAVMQAAIRLAKIKSKKLLWSNLACMGYIEGSYEDLFAEAVRRMVIEDPVSGQLQMYPLPKALIEVIEEEVVSKLAG